MKRWYWLLGLLVSSLLVGCGSGGAGGAAYLVISGSTSVSPFTEHLAELYQQQHPTERVDVQSLGSTAGIRSAIDGTSEIGMSSRELDEEEAAQLEQLLIARDALALIVHPSNPIQALSLEQVQAIFGGSINSWSELGGPDETINVVVREAGSGTFGAFDELIMESKPITPRALRQGSNGAIRQLVSGDPNAIGYISLGLVDETVKALPVNGVQPSVAHVLDGSYSFVRPFLYVWRKGHQLSPQAQRFVDYVMSPEGQHELSLQGLVTGSVD